MQEIDHLNFTNCSWIYFGFFHCKMSSCPTKTLRYFASQSDSCLNHLLRASAKDQGVSETRNSFPFMNGQSQIRRQAEINRRQARQENYGPIYRRRVQTLSKNLKIRLDINKTDLVRMRLLQNAPAVDHERQRADHPR